jgi:hypothetical protein
MVQYNSPELDSDAFICPHCNIHATQDWYDIQYNIGDVGGYQMSQLSNITDARLSRCRKCEQSCIWINGEIVFPRQSRAPQPHEDMPEEIKQDYEEARMVVDESPRAAAALLRVCIEKLLRQLTGKESDSPYSMIGDLVEEGRIDKRVQKAFDSIRVFGNESLHAGEIDMQDDSESAERLFKLMNTIVQMTITKDRLIDETFDELPDSKKRSVEQRDE